MGDRDFCFITLATALHSEKPKHAFEARKVYIGPAL